MSKNQKWYLNNLIIKTSKPKVLWNPKTLLGEGTLWVPSQKSVFFVDIKGKKIFIFNTKSKKKRVIKLNKEIGFLVHIRKNIFLLGLKSELRILDLKKNKIIKSIKIEQDKPLNRLNDGKIDPDGRLWFGSMDSLERKIRNGSLYCLDKELQLHKVDTKYFITNGPAFINSNTFLHTDSGEKIIYKIKINKKYKVIKKSKFIKFSKNHGTPDGMTIDSNKNIWICHFGGSCISVYNLKGKKKHKINLPAKNITNCVFGGNKNNELFISTALMGIKKNEIKKYPASGALLKIKTNTKGENAKFFKVSRILL